MRRSSVSVRGAGFSPSLLSSLPSGFRSSAFTVLSASSTRARPFQSQESRWYATGSAAPTVREMVNAYRRVARTPLNIQQVVKVEPEAVLEDGSVLFVHREQPIFAPQGPLPQFKDLTKEELLEIVKLRKEDPETWTITALTEKFRVPRELILKIAPTSEEYQERLKEKREEAALISSWSRPKYKGRHFGLKGGLKLTKQKMMAKAKFQKMVEEAGGLKNLMRAQNFVTHYSRKRPTKTNNRGRKIDAEPLVPGETDDAPMKKMSELDSLLDWVTPQDNVRTLLENRTNIFKMNEDPNYKSPGPIPKATPPPAAGGKPAAAPAGGKGGAPAGKQAPPPKKK